MAVKGPCPLPFTLVAGEDLRNHQFAPVALSGATVVRYQKTSDVFVGVLESKPNTNEHATVEFGPCITKVRVGGNVTAGGYLTVASGWFYAGVAQVWNGSSLTNIGSRAGALAGIALETVTSGGVCTAKVFDSITSINSGIA